MRTLATLGLVWLWLAASSVGVSSVAPLRVAPLENTWDAPAFAQDEKKPKKGKKKGEEEEEELTHLIAQQA